MMINVDDPRSVGSNTTTDLPPAEMPQVRVKFGARTDIGRARSNNEDQFLVARLAKSMTVCRSSIHDIGKTHLSDDVGYLMIVADGMGGAAGGEHASALAIRTVEDFALNSLKWFLHLRGREETALFSELRHGLERADRAIVTQAESDARLHGMGTTLTMAYSVSTDLFIVHAGDSRAYLFHDGALEQLTNDHTLVQALVAIGAIAPEEAKNHRRRHVVTNVLGGPEVGVEAEIHKLSVSDGDILLLCSDGLTEPLSNEEIAEVLRGIEDPEDACKTLVDKALERGGPDNITAVVARFEVG